MPQKKYREALLAHAAEAHQSRELLRIHTNVPVEFDITAFRYRGPTREACYELFSELGFRSLVMEYAPTADTTAKDYQLVTTLDGVQKVAAELKSAGRFAMRVLPDAPAAVRAGIVGVAFSIAPRQAWYVPIGHVEPSQLPAAESGADPERVGLPGNLFDLPADDVSAPCALCALRPQLPLRPLLPRRSSTHSSPSWRTRRSKRLGTI